MTGYSSTSDAPALTSRSGKLESAVARHWPLAAAATVYCLCCTALLLVSTAQTGGHICYILDDPFIHLAIARNLVTHGVWGVSPYQFSASSSSPGWTLLLAAVYKLTGAGLAAPLVLNILLGLAVLVTIYRFLRSRGLTQPATAATLMVVMLAMPSAPLAFTGMEHLLQAWTTLLLVLSATAAISTPAPPKPLGQTTALCALAALAVLSRYEGLFCVAPICTLLFLRKRRAQAICIAAAAAAPVAIFGAISAAHGWFWLPASIAVKATPRIGAFADAKLTAEAGLIRLSRAPHLLFLGAAALALFLARRRKSGSWEPVQVLLIIFLTALGLHLQFVPLYEEIWSFRYQGFVLAAGVTAVAAGALDQEGRSLWSAVTWRAGGRRWLLALAPCGIFAVLVTLFIEICAASSLSWLSRFGEDMLLLGFPLAAAALLCFDRLRAVCDKRAALFYTCAAISAFFFLFYTVSRGLRLTWKTPAAVSDIYHQQVQMGRFLQDFYPGRTVAANDIGAINYFADIHCVDLAGLGTIETARAILSDNYNSEIVSRITSAKHTDIAIVYDSWLAAFLPHRWIRVARWDTGPIVSASDSKVSFYATDPRRALELAADMQAFAPSLPQGVSCEQVPYASMAEAVARESRLLSRSQHSPVRGR
ncbi:MAG TPA: hypothetical protein VGS41_01155 [Chthonomonadales bacterium]|nr:hypothetical protein [Chthonomonadales bacterium]